MFDVNTNQLPMQNMFARAVSPSKAAEFNQALNSAPAAKTLNPPVKAATFPLDRLASSHAPASIHKVPEAPALVSFADGLKLEAPAQLTLNPATAHSAPQGRRVDPSNREDLISPPASPVLDKAVAKGDVSSPSDPLRKAENALNRNNSF